jgi:hypothetical protein
MATTQATSDKDVFAENAGVMAEAAAPLREEKMEAYVVGFPAKGADACGEDAASSASASTDFCDGARSQVGPQPRGCREGSRAEGLGARGAETRHAIGDVAAAATTERGTARR